MKILVWGETPLAAFLANQLASLKGHEVAWVAETLSAAPPLTCYARAEDAPPADLHLLACPNWYASDILALLRARTPYDAPSPFFIRAWPGRGLEKRIEALFGAGNSLALLSTLPLHFAPDSTQVERGAGGGLHLEADQPRSEDIRQLLAQAGLDALIMMKGEALAWAGVFWGVQANALSAILDLPPAAVYNDPTLFAYERAHLRETLRILGAAGTPLLPLAGVNLPRLAWSVRHLPARLSVFPLAGLRLRPPALRDELMAKKGRSDAAYLYGAVAREAERLKRRAPLNHALALTVTDIAEGRALWSQYKDNRRTLEATLRLALG
jgi:ketopantoate reductase